MPSAATQSWSRELEPLVAEHPLRGASTRPADARPLSLGPQAEALEAYREREADARRDARDRARVRPCGNLSGRSSHQDPELDVAHVKPVRTPAPERVDARSLHTTTSVHRPPPRAPRDSAPFYAGPRHALLALTGAGGNGQDAAGDRARRRHRRRFAGWRRAPSSLHPIVDPRISSLPRSLPALGLPETPGRELSDVARRLPAGPARRCSSSTTSSTCWRAAPLRLRLARSCALGVTFLVTSSAATPTITEEHVYPVPPLQAPRRRS